MKIWRPKNKRTWAGLALLLIVTTGLLLPENLRIPVKDAGTQDWNHASFWYTPWGRSGVHKGIDIFASKGQPVQSATGGWVIDSGSGGRGGKTVTILGPKWRCHYYAHLDSLAVRQGAWVHGGETLGTVGASGNAAGKAPHLHYTIVTAIPYPWRFRIGLQGWKRMFYLNPHARLVRVR